MRLILVPGSNKNIQFFAAFASQQSSQEAKTRSESRRLFIRLAVRIWFNHGGIVQAFRYSEAGACECSCWTGEAAISKGKRNVGECQMPSVCFPGIARLSPIPPNALGPRAFLLK